MIIRKLNKIIVISIILVIILMSIGYFALNKNLINELIKGGFK